MLNGAILTEEFDDKALSTNNVRIAISDKLTPILITRKEIYHLVFSNRLPVADRDPAIFKDNFALLRLDENRKNELHTDKFNLPDLLLDNLDREDIQLAADKIKSIHDQVTSTESSINLAFLIGPSGCGKLSRR